MSNPHRRCDGITRRELLRVGGLSAWGLGVGDLLRARRLGAAELPRAAAQSCILIWLDGGPSHLETFDPKPEAPSEVRGPLETIKTKLPGVRLSECLPQTAQLMDHLAIIRSMTSPLGEHNFGTHYLMTGYQPTPVLEYPTFGATVAHVRSQRPQQPTGILPAHIAVPHFRVGGSRLSGNGYLPSQVRPFALGGDPAKPNFQVQDLDLYQGLTIERLKRRTEVVRQLDQFSRAGDTRPSGSALDPDMERAFSLITSPEAKRAFDLSEEPASVRKRYGGKTIGQSCLLARRLIERGVPFVTVTNNGWDTHQDLTTRLKLGFAGATEGVGLVPSLDLALSALIGDLDQRGLLDETLVVVMGEFGRTPKLNSSAGRDHWPRVFSVALAGGGVPGGQVIGSSDAVGEGPRDRPITPSDLAATIYRLLGIEPDLELHTRDRRPVRIAPDDAQLIPELLG